MTSRAALLALALAACGGSHDAAPPPPKHDAGVDKRANVEIPFKSTSMEMPSMRPVPIDEPVIPLPKQDSFTLVAPGTGARAPLRYHLATAVATYATTTALTTRHVGADSAWTAPEKLPPIRDGFAISTAPATLQLRPLPATIDGTATPDAEQYVATWKALLADHRAHADVDDRGQLGTLYFNDDPTGAHTGPAKDELAQRLLATLVPLPVEPVGLGAKWRVVTILRQNFAYEKQTATYTLVARDAKTFTIGVDILRQAEEQRIADPSLPPGAIVDLLALLRTMKGTLVIDPTRPIGTGELAIESRLHVRVEAKGQTIEQLVEDTGTSTLSTTSP